MTNDSTSPLAGESNFSRQEETLVEHWRRASELERAAFITACGDELRDRLPVIDLFPPLDPLPLFDLGAMEETLVAVGLDPLNLPDFDLGLKDLDP